MGSVGEEPGPACVIYRKTFLLQAAACEELQSHNHAGGLTEQNR